MTQQNPLFKSQHTLEELRLRPSLITSLISGSTRRAIFYGLPLLEALDRRVVKQTFCINNMYIRSPLLWHLLLASPCLINGLDVDVDDNGMSCS